MRKIVPIAIMVLVIGGAAFGWWFLQNQSASAPKDKVTHPIGKSEEKANPKEHNYTDVDFAQKMIVHNQQGIQIADVAKKNATSEEVRQLAASVSEGLSNNTKQYIGWLSEWNEKYFNLSDFPQMDGHDMYPTHPGMASLGELEKLKKATGNAVDEQFLSLMIKHHEGANEMANSIAFERMQFGQMVDLKTKTLKRQAEEIQTMKQLEAKGE